MIDGEPQVIERDGRPLVVDQSGDELVCRKNTLQRGTDSLHYHRVDVEAYAEHGSVEPACGRQAYGGSGIEWLLRRKTDLDATWDGCSYRSCFGEYHPTDLTGNDSQNGLAAQLEAMSVEEFDAATHHELRSGGGVR